jgi:hypothetical protein
MIEKVLRASIVPILAMLAMLDCSSRPPDEAPTCADLADQMCRLEQACAHWSFDTTWGDIAVCKQATIHHCRQRIEALGSHETPDVRTAPARRAALSARMPLAGDLSHRDDERRRRAPPVHRDRAHLPMSQGRTVHATSIMTRFRRRSPLTTTLRGGGRRGGERSL